MRSLYHDSQLRITLATKAREAAKRHLTPENKHPIPMVNINAEKGKKFGA